MARLIRKPLQIYLRGDQERTVRALAKQEGVSMAEFIRRSIDGYVAAKLPAEDDPSLGIIALGHSAQPRLSTLHDELVAREAAEPSDNS